MQDGGPFERLRSAPSIECELTWYDVAKATFGWDAGTDWNVASHVAPSSRVRIRVVSIKFAAVGSQIMPLKQYKVAREIFWELETEPMKRARKIIVGSINLSNTWGRNVGAVRVSGVLGSSVEQVRDEFEAILLEAIAARNTSRRNRTSKELKVTFVVGREDDFHVNLFTLCVPNLRSRTHGLTENVQVTVVVAASFRHSALSCSAALVETLRIPLLGIAAGCSS